MEGWRKELLWERRGEERREGRNFVQPAAAFCSAAPSSIGAARRTDRPRSTDTMDEGEGNGGGEKYDSYLGEEEERRVRRGEEGRKRRQVAIGEVRKGGERERGGRKGDRCRK